MGNGFSTLFEKYTSIVAFDVETSGLDPYFDQIVELGAQRLFQKNGELLAEPLHYFIKLYPALQHPHQKAQQQTEQLQRKEPRRCKAHRFLFAHIRCPHPRTH